MVKQVVALLFQKSLTCWFFLRAKWTGNPAFYHLFGDEGFNLRIRNCAAGLHASRFEGKLLTQVNFRESVEKLGGSSWTCAHKQLLGSALRDLFQRNVTFHSVLALFIFGKWCSHCLIGFHMKGVFNQRDISFQQGEHMKKQTHTPLVVVCIPSEECFNRRAMVAGCESS
eukprot:6492702-Amphidinium_carterae.2